MAFPPTSEQRDCIELADTGDSMAIEALAGAGKTTTLGLIAGARRDRGVYVAFNKAIVGDVKTKQQTGDFPLSVRASTAHALAMGAVGGPYRHRLGSDGKRMYGRQLADALGIVGGIDVPLESGGRKRLMPARLGSLVMKAINGFCMTADREPTGGHTPYIDGIDKLVLGMRTYANNRLVQEYLDEYIKDAWRDLCNPNGQLPFTHSHYLKMWELGDPIIDADYILYDEAQDANPVMLSIVEQQRPRGTQLIFVGDRYQQIYGWNGAINAMETAPVDGRAYLTQSFRFGPAIADVANRALSALDAEILVRGFDSVESVVRTLDSHQTDAVLFRTNAGAIQRVLGLLFDGRKVAMVGGTAEVSNFATAASDLIDRKGTGHPQLWPFNSWQEVKDFVEGDDDGDELKSMVNLVDTFGAKNLVAKLASCQDERNADIVVSTAHKAKGREWDHVAIGDDFPDPLGPRGVSTEEMRLMYVAATRAKLVLDIDDCLFLRMGAATRAEVIEGIAPVILDDPVPEPIASAAASEMLDRTLSGDGNGRLWWVNPEGLRSRETYGSEEAALAHTPTDWRPLSPEGD